MILTAVIERLKDATGSTFSSIEGAEQLGGLAQASHGAAFVLPFLERAEPNTRIGAIRQLVHTEFLVACVIRRHDDRRGAKRAEAVDAFSAAIEGALLGWCWDVGEAEAELVSSRSAPAGNNVTFYVQTWRTERWIEA